MIIDVDAALAHMDIHDEFELQHYGVKGMKWGVTRTRDELSRLRGEHKKKKIANREKKAKEYERRAGALATRISDLQAQNKKLSWGGQRVANQDEIVRLTEAREDALGAAKAKREGKLTPRQKQLGKRVALGATLVAAYTSYTMLQTGEMNRQIMRGKAFLEGRKFEFKKDEKLSKSMTAEELHKTVVAPINPDFKKKVGTKMNCRRATFAYELRRRGYDVAATRTTNARGQDPSGMINAFSPSDADRVKSGRLGLVFDYASEKGKEIRTGKQGPITEMLSRSSGPLFETNARGVIPLFQRLAEQPDGSRGEIGMQWAGAGGHSMAYEIVDRKPVIFDTQTGKRYDSAEDWWGDTGLPKVKSIGFTRLDDKPLDLNFLMRWAKNND